MENQEYRNMNLWDYLEAILCLGLTYFVFTHDFSYRLYKIVGKVVPMPPGSESEMIVYGSVYTSMVLCATAFLYSFYRLYRISEGEDKGVPDTDSRMSLYFGACFSTWTQRICYFLTIISLSIFFLYAYTY